MESAQPSASIASSAGLRDYVSLLRPHQWIKNVVVFAGPAAGLELASVGSITRAVAAFFAFCLVASATYSINDIVDREADAKHPTKRMRPIARGAIKPAVAVMMAAVLVLSAVALCLLLVNVRMLAVLCLYFALTLSYSLALKERVILDVIIIATGFVLRAWGGSLAVGVVTSEWLVACVFTLCLFMGFGKRRCEIAAIGSRDGAGQHRRTLLRYTPDLLNHLITVSAGIAIITFLLYTLEANGHASAFHKQYLFYTLPAVVYGIFRFAMLTEHGGFGGPTDIILKDRAMQTTICVWTICALVIAYENKLFGPDGLSGLLH